MMKFAAVLAVALPGVSGLRVIDDDGPAYADCWELCGKLDVSCKYISGSVFDNDCTCTTLSGFFYSCMPQSTTTMDVDELENIIDTTSI